MLHSHLANELPLSSYGTIDISGGVPNGLIHVDTPRIGLTCKRLGIQYGRAIVGWNQVGSSRYVPDISGVVIRSGDAPQLMEAIRQKAENRRKQIERLPVLAALFTLNRRAKRCRDLAQKFYLTGMRGPSIAMRREKNRIYDLKGQVLHWMVEAGHLAGGKFHQFEFGNWSEVLEGGGYTFHRPCRPPTSMSGTKMLNVIEARPKEAKEPTLDVAYDAIEAYLRGRSRVNVYAWPAVSRKKRRK